jgi:hypothetical protein
MTNLPPLYAAWMRELLGADVPGEARSTCEDCAMVPKDPAEPGPRFDGRIKCCMFLPKLPNFLVGRVLLEGEPAGVDSVRARIADGAGLSPTGLGIPKPWATRYEAAKSGGRFGQELDLRCPHWVDDAGGRCGIWAHRESVCTTWFCRHERGAVSRHFWNALQQLLDRVEEALAKDNAEALGATGGGWGPWVEDTEGYFEACARRVEDLLWRDVVRIGGFEVRFRARLVKEAWRALQEKGVPPVLQCGRISSAVLPDGRVRVWGYSQYDPLDLAPELAALLPRFDGRPLDDVLAELATAGADALPGGLVFDEARLQELFDRRILDLPPES